MNKELNKLKFWHRIKLPDGSYTNGLCIHGPDGTDYYTSRFGIPLDLKGKTVLDIGAYDGMFSFKAEERGATVTAIDFYQNALNKEDPNKPFQTVKEILNSEVEFYQETLEQFHLATDKQFDITFYYGVLYHVQEPLTELQRLADLTKEFTLIETAISQNAKDYAMYELKPGYAGDLTNCWYPNYKGLETSLLAVGFKKVELIHDMDSRVTVKASK